MKIREMFYRAMKRDFDFCRGRGCGGCPLTNACNWGRDEAQKRAKRKLHDMGYTWYGDGLSRSEKKVRRRIVNGDFK